MKQLAVICLFLFVGCASEHRAPASLNHQHVAYDSTALGNIKASAVKSIEKQNVCFDITLIAKGVKQEVAQISNWSAAWVDNKSQYHLLNMNNRDPASLPKGGTIVAPYGAYQEWTSSFKTCAPRAEFENVKSLVLTPKSLPFKNAKGLQLTWN